MSLQNWPIKTRLLLVVGVIALYTAGMAGYSLMTLRTNLEAVTVGAEQTMQMAKSMREATDQLAADAKLLHRDMGQFVDKVRMA